MGGAVRRRASRGEESPGCAQAPHGVSSAPGWGSAGECRQLLCVVDVWVGLPAWGAALVMSWQLMQHQWQAWARMAVRERLSLIMRARRRAAAGNWHCTSPCCYYARL